MPDSDRPRRPVPAWVTAPFVDGADRAADTAAAGLEARPASASAAPVTDAAGPTAPPVAPGLAPAPGSAVPDAAARLDPDAVVPDYPPDEDLLPPAPTSPTVHTVPVDRLSTAPIGAAPIGAGTPVSPVDAAGGLREPVLAGAPTPSPAEPNAPAHQGPVVPQAGEPRFSVPGLEHVVVEGTEPAPSGPVGYRTPARFAHQQGATAIAVAQPRSFDAVLAAPGAVPVTAAVAAATQQLPTVAEAAVPTPVGAEPGLPTGDDTRPAAARRTLGATPGALLGAIAALATLGLAAWWFTAPSTVHAVGLALGAIALVCSITTLRNRAATWQRPVALLGAVLGVVGTLVLLWAVASAALPMAGVTLPDITGTGTVPTLAP
jgi:hypothetical protein